MRTALRRQVAQGAQQGLRVVIDRPDAVAGEQARERALHHRAIGEHVGHAARHAQVVLEHGELPVGQAHEVGAGHRDVAVAGDAQPAHLAPVVRAAEDQFARDDAGAQDAAVMVDVAQEQVEGGDALGQSPFELLPLRAGDDARQQIVRKDALGAAAVAVDREGDALVEEGAIGDLLAALQFGGRQRPELLEERRVVGARLPGRAEHLVVGASQGVVVEQRRLRNGHSAGLGGRHATVEQPEGTWRKAARSLYPGKLRLRPIQAAAQSFRHSALPTSTMSPVGAGTPPAGSTDTAMPAGGGRDTGRLGLCARESGAVDSRFGLGGRQPRGRRVEVGLQALDLAAQLQRVRAEPKRQDGGRGGRQPAHRQPLP